MQDLHYFNGHIEAVKIIIKVRLTNGQAYFSGLVFFSDYYFVF